jgi:hypothetical protein
MADGSHMMAPVVPYVPRCPALLDETSEPEPVRRNTGAGLAYEAWGATT